MRRALFALLLLLPVHAVRAEPLWQTLPPTPAPVPGEHTGRAKVNGINLYYATIGHGSPVVLLHGGLSNSDYWGNQIKALAPHHTVIVMDSRGHGRSTRDARPYGYDLMADDVVAMLDTLHIAKADVVGWSDGAILGLDLAIRYPDRVGKVFAFAANTITSGVQEGVEKNPTFAAFIERAGHEYAKLSATPKDYDAFVAQISKMWETEPNWTDAQLQSIRAPVLVADGDHDEAIKRAHTEYIAATIPGAGLLILPNTSHFAFLQDPTLFNAALLHFLSSSDRKATASRPTWLVCSTRCVTAPFIPWSSTACPSLPRVRFMHGSMPAGSAARSCCCRGPRRDGLNFHRDDAPSSLRAPASSELVIAPLMSLHAATCSPKISGSLCRNDDERTGRVHRADKSSSRSGNALPARPYGKRRSPHPPRVAWLGRAHLSGRR